MDLAAVKLNGVQHVRPTFLQERHVTNGRIDKRCLSHGLFNDFFDHLHRFLHGFQRLSDHDFRRFFDAWNLLDFFGNQLLHFSFSVHHDVRVFGCHSLLAQFRIDRRGIQRNDFRRQLLGHFNQAGELLRSSFQRHRVLALKRIHRTHRQKHAINVFGRVQFDALHFPVGRRVTQHQS